MKTSTHPRHATHTRSGQRQTTNDVAGSSTFAAHLTSNKDGSTQRADRAPPKGRPPRPDSDGDGVLNDAELSKMAEHLSQQTGKDVTVDELKAKLDADGDGTVTTAEMPSPKEPPPGEKHRPQMRDDLAVPPMEWSDDGALPPLPEHDVDAVDS